MSNTIEIPENASVALALGGGGVKGLAHIALLKKFDELNIRPSLIAGTSMGAIIGALYANGISGAEIEDKVRDHLFVKGEKLKSIFRRRKQLIKWTKIFALEKSKGGFITTDGLFDHLFHELIDVEFKDLRIPFIAVATNYNSGKEHGFSSGNVLQAVKASMAVPGVFAPVNIENETYVDGGVVNNLPVNHIYQQADIMLASDVVMLDRKTNPNPFQSLSGSINIMLRHATETQLVQCPPHFLFQPDTSGIELFDFLKIGKVLERGDRAIEHSFKP